MRNFSVTESEKSNNKPESNYPVHHALPGYKQEDETQLRSLDRAITSDKERGSLLVHVALEAPIPFRLRLGNSEFGEELCERARRLRPLHLLQRIHKLVNRHITPIHRCLPQNQSTLRNQTKMPPTRKLTPPEPPPSSPPSNQHKKSSQKAFPRPSAFEKNPNAP
jgi:hypothetical protein